ncbi:MAG: hypothetical protein KC635_21455, partial [Myxococcales bacterium]|nr:hypothetical protein [Myxococcales bacterium]
ADAVPDAETDSDSDTLADADAALPCVLGAPCVLSAPPPTCVEGRCDAVGACVPAPIAGCCRDDAECALEPLTSACGVPRCVAGACREERSPGCCEAAADCDDGVASTTDACGPDTGLCTHCYVGGACPSSPPDLVADFDAAGSSLALLGFPTADNAPSDGVAWRLSSRRAVSPPSAAWVGRADCPSYYTGAVDAACAPVDPAAQDAGRVAVTLRTPRISLGDAGPPSVASFWLFSDVEPYRGAAAEPDVLRVFVDSEVDGVTWEIGSSLGVGKSTGGAWRLVALDLAPWRGRIIRLRFELDTLDGQDNDHEGVYVDDLRVGPTCAAGGCCTADTDCAAAGPEGDACRLSRCVPTSNGAGRVCVDGPRAPGAACTACALDPDCADDDPCTLDRCGLDGRCVHEPFCCLRVDYLATGFEGSLGGWWSSPLAGSALWQLRPGAGFGAGDAAWFGVPGEDDYDAGEPVAGTLTSPPIALPADPPGDGGLEVAFALRLDTEWSDAPYDNPGGLDRLRLDVLTPSAPPRTLWTSDAIGGTTRGAWTVVAVPLDAFAGATVQLQLAFDSVDAERNDYGGAYVDDVAVRTRCAP